MTTGTLAVVEAAGSATEVAFMVKVPGSVGAVYIPAEVTEPPADSTTDQVTDWLVEFITVAVKVRSAPVARIPLGPAMVTVGAGGGGAGAGELPEPHPESCAAKHIAARRIGDTLAEKRGRKKLLGWFKRDICELAGDCRPAL
jgi:hypothetical protein